MTGLVIENGRTLLGGDIVEAPLHIAQDKVVETGKSSGTARLDARDLLVLPGIVDIHGDAFERQMMPRPGVDFATDIALLDSDRQAIANGITTVFHGITWSWEPGLRGADNARCLVEAIETLRPHLAADTRIHLRHETYNLEAEDTLTQWLEAGRVDLLAFNDHMDSAVVALDNPHKRARMVERCGLSDAQFDSLVGGVLAHAPDVAPSVARLAKAANAAGIRTLSHDDRTVEDRRRYRALGVGIAEFPVNEETAREAAAGYDFIVFGAPNVVRGGSHTGWTRASDMIAKGLCSVLASDYYYPAQLLAAFRLAHDGILPLSKAWHLVSTAPAVAAGLTDRGSLTAGSRADVILVDDRIPLRPRVVASITAGRLVHLTDAARLANGVSLARANIAAA